MSSSRHSIPLELAVSMVARARASAVLPVRGWGFDRDIIDTILGQPGAAGIRLYLATDEAGAPTLVVVGTDANQRDLASGEIGELAWPCPPLCDPDSPFKP